MIRLIKKASQKVGLAPGTMIHVGEKKIEKTKIHFFNYNEDALEENEAERLDDIFSLKDSPDTTWINIDGLHEIETIEKIGRHFGVHALTLEDIVHTEQRAKMEEFDQYIYVVLKMLFMDKDNNEIHSEQISFVLGENFLLTFQEMTGDIFNGVRDRIRKAKGRIRKKGADYLLYALMDAVIDGYFLVLDYIGEQTEDIEEIMLTDSSHDTLLMIHNMKRELIFFRRQVWPIREFLNTLINDELLLMDPSIHVFLRDLYDHTFQVIDTIESLRDVLTGLQDVYLSGLSNKMNEVMKVLTVIATIFIPVSFLAGVYGMNFRYMPELELKWSYPLFWVLVTAIIVLMVVWFKRKKWL